MPLPHKVQTLRPTQPPRPFKHLLQPHVPLGTPSILSHLQFPTGMWGSLCFCGFAPAVPCPLIFLSFKTQLIYLLQEVFRVGSESPSGLTQLWCFPLHDIGYSLLHSPARLRAPQEQSSDFSVSSTPSPEPGTDVTSSLGVAGDATQLHPHPVAGAQNVGWGQQFRGKGEKD